MHDTWNSFGSVPDTYDLLSSICNLGYKTFFYPVQQRSVIEGGSVTTASTSVTVLALPNVITAVTVAPAALRTGLVLLVNMVRERGKENYHYIFF